MEELRYVDGWELHTAGQWRRWVLEMKPRDRIEKLHRNGSTAPNNSNHKKDNRTPVIQLIQITQSVERTDNNEERFH